MKKMNRFLFSSFVLAVVCVFAVSGPAQAVSYTGNTGLITFDSLGTTGTALPAGWSLWYDNDSGNASTWNTSISAAQVQGMGQSGTQAAVSAILDNPGITSTLRDADQWYNIARSTTTSNRVISTSPTTNAGMAFQFELTNNTGSALNQITLSYDIVKFHNGWDAGQTGTPDAESIPGYRLFYALGTTDSTWYSFSELDPTAADIPQGTLGSLGYLSLSRNATITLGTAWGTGTNLYLRWVDDNGFQLSPDNVIGLDNVQVVPIPAAAWLLGTGLVGLVALRRRKK